MTKAYLNALKEEGTRDDMFRMVCELDAQNDQLRADKRRLDEKVSEQSKRIQELQMAAWKI